MNTYIYCDQDICYMLTVIISNLQNLNSIDYQIQLL
jgi:hypothetical protein